MSTGEAAPTLAGPRFAPEDPTLPNPWKGLIDGTTGLLYYWNPETNVTQYERPTPLPPPLPSGPPPPATTPKLAPIPVPHTSSLNGATQQLGQQILQQTTDTQIQQQQPSQQTPYQQAPQLPAQISHQNLQQKPQQYPHQQTQQYPQMQMQQMQYPPMGQQAPYYHHQQPQGPQIPYQQVHQQGNPPIESQIMHSQGQPSPGIRTMHEQSQNSRVPQIGHQQGQQQQGPQSAYPQGQNLQGQQITNQHGHQAGFPRAEDSSHQEGKPTSFSLPLVQQAGVIPSDRRQLHGVGPRPQNSQFAAPSMAPQEHLGGTTSVNAQQAGASLVQLNQTGIDISYKQRGFGIGNGPVAINQIGHTMVRPPVGLQMGYDEDRYERLANEFHPPSRIDGPMAHPQQPKLASHPLPRNQQDMRMGPVNSQLIIPAHSGGLNPGLAHGVLQSPMRPSPRMPSPRMSGPLDYTHISATDAYRQHHEVTAMGDDVPAPFMTFEATGFPPEILREMHHAGFSTPTPIQAQTWPIALQSRDIVAIAKTGSGKTLGYLIPSFIHLRRCRNNPQFGPTVLVLAPTRELATQIQDETIKFGRSSGISCTCLYGGAPKGPQLKELERGADIVVATPGRLNDILEMKKIDFRQVSFLVLDEADRMLDMGFEPQIRKIVNEIPPRRQTLMYTATWPKEVRKIAGDLLVNPVQVNIGNVDELAANKSITQYVEVVSPMDKQSRLEQILRTQARGSKIIIFCSTKKLCDQLARGIRHSFGAAAIHGDKSQGERDYVLNQFRSGKAPILVATDVAARGLDIKDIRVVINYDFPTGVEDYVHRIGRTGRAGATGIAYTFFSDQDWKYAPELVKVLEGANQQVPPEIREMAARGGHVFSQARGGVGRGDPGAGGRWDFGGRGRGMRDGGGFTGGRGGGRNDFHGGRGGGRNDFQGGRGGGRNDFHGGHEIRGRGFGRPAPGGPGGWGRHDRYDNQDGPRRFNDRRRNDHRGRDRSYSRSPGRSRTRGYRRSRSRSRSRSWTRSRSRSRSFDRVDRAKGRNFSRPSNFSQPPPPVGESVAVVGPDVSGAPLGAMSPMSPSK